MARVRRFFAWLLLTAYVLATVVLHRKVNVFIGSFATSYGLETYTKGVKWLSYAAGLIVLAFTVRNLLKDRTRVRQLALLIPIALIIDMTMISRPIERIHYLQYGILTWLCYNAIPTPFTAAMVAFLIGYVDEAHQFWVLYADDPSQYFDWNDVALNLLGVLAVLFIFLPRQPTRAISKRRVVAALALWVMAAGLLVWYFDADRYLFRNDPYLGSKSFWILSYVGYRYHIMDAFQGIVFCGVVLIPIVSSYLKVQSDDD